MKFTIEILDEDAVISPEHWCRPLYLQYGCSDHIFTRSEWGGGPINNMKWIKVGNVLGPAWYGKKYKDYYNGEYSMRYEVVIGDIPESHILKKEEY